MWLVLCWWKANRTSFLCQSKSTTHSTYESCLSTPRAFPQSLYQSNLKPSPYSCGITGSLTASTSSYFPLHPCSCPSHQPPRCLLGGQARRHSPKTPSDRQEALRRGWSCTYSPVKPIPSHCPLEPHAGWPIPPEIPQFCFPWELASSWESLRITYFLYIASFQVSRGDSFSEALSPTGERNTPLYTQLPF